MFPEQSRMLWAMIDDGRSAKPRLEMGGKGLPVESAASREKRTVVWVKRIVVMGSRELCVCSVGDCVA